MTLKHSIALLICTVLKKFNASPKTNRIFIKFINLEDYLHKSLEISSDTTQRSQKNYLRASLFRLRRDELMKLISREDLHGLKLDKLLFFNKKDPCFGLGINDYQTAKMKSRIKLYNFYYQSHQKINVHQHIKTICGYCGINPSWVTKDNALLQDIQYSCIDVYFNGTFSLKVYSQSFLTADIFEKYQGVFTASALKNYKKLFNAGYLPKTAGLCIQYYGKTRSIRLDFLFNTRDVLPYLDAFDVDGSARRLYQDIITIRKGVKLTAITIDADKKLKTQFYFQYLLDQLNQTTGP